MSSHSFNYHNIQIINRKLVIPEKHIFFTMNPYTESSILKDFLIGTNVHKKKDDL